MRRELAALGAVLVLAGIVVSLSPGLGADLSPTAVAIAGVCAATIGTAAVALSSSPSKREEEHCLETDLLGGSFDAALSRSESMSSTELRREDAPRELRERLRAAAVATVARRAGVDRETAAERVASGEWTTDSVAAAFLSESTRAPLQLRLRERLSTTPRVVLRARRTAAVLEGEL